MILTVLLIIGLITNAFGLYCFLKNKRFLNTRRIPLPDTTLTQPLKVSILIPARNEEINIENIIRSIMSQTYKNIEIIVCDDQSTDNTPKILAKMKDEFPQLKIILGKPLPKDWMGKCWACHNLSEEATGDWLAFFDADATLQPRAIEFIVNEINNSGPETKVATGFTSQIVGSIGELLIMPCIMIFAYSLMGFFENFENLKKKEAAASGQCLWFEHKTYKEFGGHNLVYNQIAEDVEFAKCLKALGIKMRFMNIFDYVDCRMYRNFKEIWNGFKKNVYPATKSDPLVLVAPIFVISSQFLPFAYVLFGLPQILTNVTFDWFIALVSYLIIIYVTYGSAFLVMKSKITILIGLFMPLSCLLCAVLFIDSFIAARRGKLVWKSRIYTDEVLELPKKEKQRKTNL